MSSAFNHGIQSSAFLPSIYNDQEALDALRISHLYFQDNYERIFKRYGIKRTEMLHVMPDLLKVDPLVGTEILPYLEP